MRRRTTYHSPVPADRVQQLLDAMAERLQRSVVLDDPTVRPLATSRHFGDADEVRIQAVLQHDPGAGAIGHVLAQGVTGWIRAGHIPANPELGMHARWCVPVRWHGELLGLVIVMDARRDLSAEQAGWLVGLADDLAAVLVADRSSDPARDESLVAAAVDPDVPVRRRALAELDADGRLRPTDVVQVIALRVVAVDRTRPPTPAYRAGILRHVLHHVAVGPGLRLLGGLRDEMGVGLVTGPADLPLRTGRLASALATGVANVGGGALTGVVGVGAPAVATGAWRSFREAQVAARCVPRLRAGPVVEFAGLGMENLLARIPEPEWDETLVPPALRALAAADPDGRLRHTLEVFLAAGNAGQETADRLHVHRTTLHYRLDRIRDLTGVDLDDGWVRASLLVGLLVSRVQDVHPDVSDRSSKSSATNPTDAGCTDGSAAAR